MNSRDSSLRNKRGHAGIHKNVPVHSRAFPCILAYYCLFPYVPVHSRVFLCIIDYNNQRHNNDIHDEYTQEDNGRHRNTWEYRHTREYTGTHGSTREYAGIHGNTSTQDYTRITGNRGNSHSVYARVLSYLRVFPCVPV